MSKEVVAEVIALIELGLIAPEDIVKCLRKANSEPKKALAEQPAQQEPVAWLTEERYAEMHTSKWTPKIQQVFSKDGILESQTIQYAPQSKPVSYPPAQRTHECGRSHPHENMDAMCELRTEIARLTNENARLKARPQQEPFGYLYEGTAEHTRGKTVFQRKPAERLEKRWWREIGPCYTSPPAQRKPLTDEEIDELSRTMVKGNKSVNWLCRAIEAAHGIKENT